jgi:hypothetical protein
MCPKGEGGTYRSGCARLFAAESGTAVPQTHVSDQSLTNDVAVIRNSDLLASRRLRLPFPITSAKLIVKMNLGAEIACPSQLEVPKLHRI